MEGLLARINGELADYAANILAPEGIIVAGAGELRELRHHIIGCEAEAVP